MSGSANGYILREKKLFSEYFENLKELVNF